VKTCGFYLAALMLLAVSGLFLANVHDALASCGTSDDVDWSPNSAGTDATAGAFTYDGPLFSWTFRETPFIGVAEIHPNVASTNIASSSYDPAYWFPNNCQGAIQIAISGTLSNPNSSGTLITRGYCWDSGSPSPYAEDRFDLSITP